MAQTFSFHVRNVCVCWLEKYYRNSRKLSNCRDAGRSAIKKQKYKFKNYCFKTRRKGQFKKKRVAFISLKFELLSLTYSKKKVVSQTKIKKVFAVRIYVNEKYRPH